MRIITDIQIRYGHVLGVDPSIRKLMFDSGFMTTGIPCITGIRNRKLSHYIHFFLTENAIQRARDLKPSARAFLQWVRWLEETGVDPFTPAILRYKSPSYGFREYLLTLVEHQHMASSTASGYIGVIRRFYAFLARCGELDAGDFFTPVEKVIDGGRKLTSSDLVIRIRKKTNRTINPLNEKERNVLSDVLSSESISFRLMISLMKNCGLRLDEMLTLPSSVFNEEYLACSSESEGIIRGITIGPGCGVHTKFGASRELFITRSQYEQVLDYLISEDYERKITRWRGLQKKSARHEPLFIMTNGKRISEKAFYSRWYSFRSRLAAEMPDNRFRHKPHDLRATFATEFLRAALRFYPEEASNALGTVKYWMGHKSENTTMKYIIFLQQNEISDAVASVMDAVMEDATAPEGREHARE